MPSPASIPLDLVLLGRRRRLLQCTIAALPLAVSGRTERALAADHEVVPSIRVSSSPRATSTARRWIGCCAKART